MSSISTVSFFTAFTHRNPDTFVKKVENFVEDLLFFDISCFEGKKAIIFKNNGNEYFLLEKVDQSVFFTALKVVAAATLVIPLLTIITKLILRVGHNFVPAPEIESSSSSRSDSKSASENASENASTNGSRSDSRSASGNTSENESENESESIPEDAFANPLLNPLELDYEVEKEMVPHHE